MSEPKFHPGQQVLQWNPSHVLPKVCIVESVIGHFGWRQPVGVFAGWTLLADQTGWFYVTTKAWAIHERLLSRIEDEYKSEKPIKEENVKTV